MKNASSVSIQMRVAKVPKFSGLKSSVAGSSLMTDMNTIKSPATTPAAAPGMTIWIQA